MAVVLVLLFFVVDLEPDPLALASVVAAALPPVVTAAELDFEAEAELPELWAAVLDFEAVSEVVVAVVASVSHYPHRWKDHTNLVQSAASRSEHLYSPAKAAMAMLLLDL